MASAPASPTPEPGRWWLLPTIEADGAWQMACDTWLLERAVAGCSEPVLRFYRWRRPTLSLGFHQRQLEPHWPGLAADGLIDLVRRPSGGRAVLHAGSLTYALIWPQAPRERLTAYRRACGWLQAGFGALGLPLQFGRSALRGQPSHCFALGTAADLCHRNGVKRVGSAQLWRRGQLLQHGSVLVAPPPALWQLVFGSAPAELPLLSGSLLAPGRAGDPLAQLEALEQHLIATARRQLPVDLALLPSSTGMPRPREDPLTAADEAGIRACRLPDPLE